MSKVSVIIVNYNTCDLLKKCLLNLKEIYPQAEIVVVDNESYDGSSQMVTNSFPDVILVKSKNNGLAAGSNLGLKKASGDYLLYLGSDAFPQKGVIEGILDYMQSNKDVGIATSKMVLRDGSLDMDAHRGFPTPWASITHFTKLNKLFFKSKLFNQYFLGYMDLNLVHEIDLCISHFMMIKRKVFDDIGLWDEDFFVYGEDVDFCYRAKEKGWKIMYLPQFETLHYKGTSVGIRKETADISTASPQTKKRMRESSTSAMKLFYSKHYKNKYPAFVTNIVLFGIDVLSRLRTIK